MTVPDHNLAPARLAPAELDEEWYRLEYPDVELSDMSPAEHYLLVGKKLGRKPNANEREAHFSQAVSVNADNSVSPPFESFGIIRHDPLISILIVSFNSGTDLETLLPSIARQTYRNIEVVLIENGSEDTEPLLRRYFASGRFDRADNVGFAEGNNLALRLAEGELVALINPDTRLEPDMIQNLLDSIRFDAEAAAVVPKILFFERFIRISIRADGPFSVSRDDLVAGLPYRKLFARVGSQQGAELLSDEAGVLEVDLPYTSPRKFECVLRARGGNSLRQGWVQIGYSKPLTTLSVPTVTLRMELALDDINCSSARYLVNNAGSGLHPDGSPFDRGFAQVDNGEFYSKAYVEAICGCAALIRRIALVKRQLFPRQFFAYYEDSELSFELRTHGYRILYQPQAVIYHRHSESTEENSQLWQVLVQRSRKLYDMSTGVELLPPSYFKFDYPASFTHPLRSKLEALDEQVRVVEAMTSLSSPVRPTACVYNSYFSSMGGGEKHALDIARLLIEKYDVFIASEEDFDIPELEDYFQMDLAGARKLISTNIDRHFTSKFDLFVNATFRSNLSSSAGKNLYAVSFPHEDFAPALPGGSFFVHNSKFTETWAEKYWGRHESAVIYPVIGQAHLFEQTLWPVEKRNIILSVGRFTSQGHCKNHHRTLEAFRELATRSHGLPGWTLKIIGSCNMSDQEAVRYLGGLNDRAKGFEVEILPNAPRSVLNAAYREASIYVHAAGLGVSMSRPEQHEHFGITVFEAMAHGCLPVVYAEGGPADQVRSTQHGLLFANFAELVQALELAMKHFVTGQISPAEISRSAKELYDVNLETARQLLLGEG